METRTEMFDNCMVKNVNRPNQNLQGHVAYHNQIFTSIQSEFNFYYVEIEMAKTVFLSLNPEISMTIHIMN